MRYTKDQIKKGLFMTGQPCSADWQRAGPQPLCHVYKAQQQQPSVSLEDIGARIEAVRKKVEALRAQVKRP